VIAKVALCVWTWFVACAVLVATATPAFASPTAADPYRALDDSAAASAWQAAASDQVEATLRHDGDAVCLDFDFHGVSGYAALRRRLPIDYPANYEFSFRVRGDAPDNALQFKLADAKGENVWWVNRPDFVFPHDWQQQRYRKRQIDFAWGPTTDKTLRHSDTIEFTLYAGKGGRGSVCFDSLGMRELPLPPATWPRPLAHASSERADARAANAVDGDANTAWRSDPQRGAQQTLTLDFGSEREFGGVVLHWADAAFASDYDVELSSDEKTWRRVRSVHDGNGGIDPLYLPESSARYLRLSLHAGPSASYALADVDIKDLAFGASANAFFAELAKKSPRGFYPRGFYNEQTYWTLVGTDGGHETGLLSEDGALEVARGGFSVEPFLIDEKGHLASWADVAIDHHLQDDYLPIPSVVWQLDGLRLTTTAFADKRADGAQLIASYTLENSSNRARTLTLALAVQPFQVNPSVQFLSTPGGVSPIHSLAWDGRAVAVDGKPRVFALDPPSSFEASRFDAGMIVEQLDTRGRALQTDSTPPSALPAWTQIKARRMLGGIQAGATPVRDETGLASGALLYRIELAPRSSRTLALAIPLEGNFHPPADGGTALQTRRAAVAADWHARLDGVGLHLPAVAQPLADTLRTALAHILINRDGAAIRPGTRSYARSWIRDGAMMSEALLRLGRADAARDYLTWYAPYQFKNGKVPCCVDQRGADPVPENDSHGELIHLVDEVYRYGGDKALLGAMWPHVDAATRYMDTLRASERTPQNQSAERSALYGLMPASISHEGYSAKPMHSYWDDFWALTGYKNAVDIATTLGKADDAKRLAASRDEFRSDLYASIRAAVAAHHIDYLPGAAELGDFDATSTTIALSPAGEQASLPQDLLHNTFERYWTTFEQRRNGAPWKDYTPYEWRTVSSFVRLGWRERAQTAIAFFMHDRRPAGWNQWAEVVGRDARESRFIGDMPHGWVASDFIRSALDLFACERAADQALVLAAGVPSAWLEGDGIAIENLRTPYGKLGYALKRDGNTLRLKIDATGSALPPGGFVFAGPGLAASGTALLNGRKLPWLGGEVRIRELPAELIIDSGGGQSATHE